MEKALGKVGDESREKPLLLPVQQQPPSRGSAAQVLWKASPMKLQSRRKLLAERRSPQRWRGALPDFPFEKHKRPGGDTNLPGASNSGGEANSSTQRGDTAVRRSGLPPRRPSAKTGNKGGASLPRHPTPKAGKSPRQTHHALELKTGRGVGAAGVSSVGTSTSRGCCRRGGRREWKTVGESQQRL